MVKRYDHVLEIVAENPGEPIELITDLAADRNTTETDLIQRFVFIFLISVKSSIPYPVQSLFRGHLIHLSR